MPSTGDSSHRESEPRSGLRNVAVTAASLVSALLLTLTAINATGWIGRTFPGFFLMANRVVPSVSLPTWDGAAAANFQNQVLAVNGETVASAAEVYEKVQKIGLGAPIRYDLRTPQGENVSAMLSARRFALSDFALVFGAYLFCAGVFLAVALVVVRLRPNSSAAYGFLSACVGLGAYALTGADLYGPHWWFRAHVAAESLFPAGIIHLALVFPTDRLRARRRVALAAVYLPFILLAVLYQFVLYWPSAYTRMHLIASAAQGLSGTILLLAVAYDRWTTESALVRWRVGIVGAGVVTAFAGPAVLTGASGLWGGSVPVNGAAFTAFLFPLSVGYAIVRRDLLASGIFAAWAAAGDGGDTAPTRLGRLLNRLQGLYARADALAKGHLAFAGALLAGAGAACIIGAISQNSTAWLGRSFPGFLVMENRVVPSIALPSWQTNGAALFQHQVVAIDGTAVTSSREIYAAVAGLPQGRAVAYTLRAPDGDATTQTISSRRFSETDYASLFAPFLLTGSAFVAAGLVVFLLCPGSAIGAGMLSLGLVGGLFVVSAVDLYGPHWFFRLHVLLEAMVPASLIHLALVFPTDRLRRGAQPFLLGVYLFCALMAVVYEMLLFQPTAYSALHLASLALQGVGGLAMLWVMTYDLLTTSLELVRRRILIVTAGAIAAFLLPTVLSAYSGLSDGSVAVNGAAFTGLFFPLCLGYAVIRRDPLKVDVFLRQVALLVLAATTGTCYAVASGIVALKSRLS